MSFRNDFGYVFKDISNIQFLAWLPDSSGYICLNDRLSVKLQLFDGSRSEVIPGLPRSENKCVFNAKCVQKDKNTVFVWFMSSSDDLEVKLFSYKLSWVNNQIQIVKVSELPTEIIVESDSSFSADSKSLTFFNRTLGVYYIDDEGVIHTNPGRNYPWLTSLGKHVDLLSFDGRYILSAVWPGDEFLDNHRGLEEIDGSQSQYQQIVLRVIDRRENDSIVFSVRCALKCARWSPVENKLVMCMSEIDGRPQNLDGELIKLRFFVTVWTPDMTPRDMKRTILPRTCISTIPEFSDKHRVELFNDLMWSPDGSKVFGQLKYPHRTQNIGYGRVIDITESPIFDCVGDSLVWRCNISTSEMMGKAFWTPDSKTIAIVQRVPDRKHDFELNLPFFSADTGSRVLLIVPDYVRKSEDVNFINILFSPDGSRFVKPNNNYRPNGVLMFDLRQHEPKTHLQLAPVGLKQEVFGAMTIRHYLNTHDSGIPPLPAEMWLMIISSLSRLHFKNARLDLRRRYGSDLEPLWFLKGENAITWPPRPLSLTSADESEEPDEQDLSE